jgi:hypothetical protein
VLGEIWPLPVSGKCTFASEIPFLMGIAQVRFPRQFFRTEITDAV